MVRWGGDIGGDIVAGFVLVFTLVPEDGEQHLKVLKGSVPEEVE